jgi:cation diffusion facilitator family transporter
MLQMTNQDQLQTRRAMKISVGAGLLMLMIKFGAYFWTGSSAILSDAAESIVHIIAVIFAAYSLWLSTKPADAQHPYGHAKISFFSAGAEGMLILIAAAVIIYTAISDWIGGLSLRNLEEGIALTAFAALINLGLGLYLIRVGRRRQSIILEANGQHVLTDCWTSFGVVAGLFLAQMTGWLFLDPICAILVALNIVYSGAHLLKRSIGGLMDTADPDVQQKITALLDRECQDRGITYHHLRQHFNGQNYDIDVHLIFPDAMAIKDAHRVATAIEQLIQRELSASAHIITHLEPREDHQVMHNHSVDGDKTFDPT